ncbi:MAG: hypothetical protein SynsKO_18940 [Synoicihabitans sp.]
MPAVDDDWSRYESENFELYSDQSDRASRGILEDLEILRALFIKEMNVVERKRMQVTVYAFNRSSDYQAYTHHYKTKRTNTAGMYLRRPDRAVIMLRPMETRDSSRQVVFHEYVHHMFRAVDLDPPVWFNEGLADVLGGIKIGKKEVEIGHPMVGRLYPLQNAKLLPLETLFRVTRDSRHYNTDEHAGLFYAQSFALLHYWKYGKSKISPEAVNRFIAVAGSTEAMKGTNIQSLFEECFGMDYRAMEKQLSRYVRRGRYTYGKIPRPELPGPSTYAKSEVSKNQIRIRLAELAVRTRGDALGQLVLLEAGEAEDADPRIFETLGADSMVRGDEENGLQYWRKAAELGSTNSTVLRELARAEWNKWFRNYVPTFKLPKEVADDLRALLVASIRSEPVQDDAYEMLAWVEGFVEEPKPGNINAVQQRFKHMKRKARTLLALAMSRDRMDFRDEGISLLENISRFEPDEWTLRAAEATLADWLGKDASAVFLGDSDDGVRAGAKTLHESVISLPSVPVPDDLGEGGSA